MNKLARRCLCLKFHCLMVLVMTIVVSVLVIYQPRHIIYAANVVIGHATIGEKGKKVGTKPGDQSGKEVCLMNYTYHKGGWSDWNYVARANEPEVAIKIAKSMEMLCKNDKIGYGQDGPQAYKEAKKVNFDLTKMNKKTNGDCFDMVAICLCAAGTPNLLSIGHLEYSDTFKVYKGKDYRTKPDKLQPGDILITSRSKHSHGAVVVYSSNKATGADPHPTSSFKKGARYTVTKAAFTYKGPGSAYELCSYHKLSSEGKALARFSNDFASVMMNVDDAYIPADTEVTCLEAKRNWIRTVAGWIDGETIVPTA